MLGQVDEGTVCSLEVLCGHPVLLQVASSKPDSHHIHYSSDLVPQRIVNANDACVMSL